MKMEYSYIIVDNNSYKMCIYVCDCYDIIILVLYLFFEVVCLIYF